MILLVDIGNTNVKFGLFDGDSPRAFWRVSTKASRTSDEYGMLLYDLLRQQNIGFDNIEAAVMSSVTPALNYTIAHMCQDYLKKEPMLVTRALDVGVKIAYDNSDELGTDRIVCAAAAYRYYGGPVIAVDFGTATTFNLVRGDGTFIGGAISPGIKTSAESLSSAAAKLPIIELSAPESIVGTDTKSCMQSGIVYGYAGLVKYMVEKYRQVDGMRGAKVVATGGLSQLIESAEPDLFDVVDRALALKGLKFIYDINGGAR